MKKSVFILLTFLLLLAACSKEDGIVSCPDVEPPEETEISNEEAGSGYGFVVQNSAGVYLLYGVASFGYPITSTSIEEYGKKFGDNRFVGVAFRVNYDSVVNAGFEKRGYAISESLDIIDLVEQKLVYARYEEICKEPVPNEVLPIAIAQGSYMINNHVVLGVAVEKYGVNDEIRFYLEYDATESMPNEKYEGHNVYDMYLRVQHIQSNVVGNSMSEDVGQFDLSDPIRHFKMNESHNSAGFFIRINKVSYKDETEVVFKNGIILAISYDDFML